MRICCDWRCCWRREGLVLALLVGLSGCSTPWLPTFYRVPVTQGQVVDEARIAQLQVGMSQAEVRALLGEPLLRDPFQTNRWDYTYSRRSGSRELARRRLTVHFDQGIVQQIDGNFADELATDRE